TWPLPTGLGGVFGDFVLKLPALFTGSYPKGLFGLVVAAILFVPALWLMFFGAGLIGRRAVVVAPADEPEESFEDFDEDEDTGSDGFVALGILAHWWLSACAFVRRRFLPAREDDAEDEFDLPVHPATERRVAAGAGDERR